MVRSIKNYETKLIEFFKVKYERFLMNECPEICQFSTNQLQNRPIENKKSTVHLYFIRDFVGL
jgi:hypothetical protein